MANINSIPKISIVLDTVGLTNLKSECWNLPTPALYEEALKRNEGNVSHLGPFVVRTGQFTRRSPDDKFVVEESVNKDKIWWGKVNRLYNQDKCEELEKRMSSYLQGKDVFVQDCWCGADPNVYAELLGEKIARHEVKCWLVNTDWTGGPESKKHVGGQWSL